MNCKRFKREEKTIQALLSIYCKNFHSHINEQLCPECTVVLDYAAKRLLACPFQNNKPTCANCSVHCYNKEMQENVRKIMKYAGPRLIFKHPILSICHILDGRIKSQSLKKEKTYQTRQ